MRSREVIKKSLQLNMFLSRTFVQKSTEHDREIRSCQRRVKIFQNRTQLKMLLSFNMGFSITQRWSLLSGGKYCLILAL